MISSTLVQLLIGFSVVVLQASCTSRARILGGIETDISKHKYMVSIDADEFLCGGVLLRPDIVLTAEHCVYGIKKYYITVTAGSSNYHKEGVQSKVKYVKMYNNRVAFIDKFVWTGDIALLKLETPLVGPSISTIDLPDSNPPYGVLMTAIGWGIAKKNGTTPSNVLKSVELKTMSSKQCRQQYHISTTNGMFCTMSEGKDTCRGDSGGPLVYQGKIYGVTSGGDCDDDKVPGVFINVFAYKKWIEKVCNSEKFRA